MVDAQNFGKISLFWTRYIISDDLLIKHNILNDIALNLNIFGFFLEYLIANNVDFNMIAIVQKYSNVTRKLNSPTRVFTHIISHIELAIALYLALMLDLAIMVYI